MSQLFAASGQSIGVSVSTSVLPMNTQDRSPLGWTGWISLQSKGLSEESLPLVLINELHPSTFKSAIHSKLTLASIFFFFFTFLNLEKQLYPPICLDINSGYLVDLRRPDLRMRTNCKSKCFKIMQIL